MIEPPPHVRAFRWVIVVVVLVVLAIAVVLLL